MLKKWHPSVSYSTQCVLNRGRVHVYAWLVVIGSQVVLRRRRSCSNCSKQLGHEGVVLYDRRKTAVSLAFAAGATIPEAMARFGHVDAPMALEAYASTFPDSDARLAERLDAVPEGGAGRHRASPIPLGLAKAMENSRSRPT